MTSIKPTNGNNGNGNTPAGKTTIPNNKLTEQLFKFKDLSKDGIVNKEDFKDPEIAAKIEAAGYFGLEWGDTGAIINAFASSKHFGGDINIYSDNFMMDMQVIDLEAFQSWDRKEPIITRDPNTGKIIQRVAYDNSRGDKKSFNGYNIENFDLNGNLLSKINYNQDQSINILQTFEYDTDGNKIGSKRYLTKRDGGTIIQTRDGNNKSIKAEIYDANGKLIDVR